MPWLSLKRGMPGARAGRRWGRRLHPSPASTSPSPSRPRAWPRRELAPSSTPPGGNLGQSEAAYSAPVSLLHTRFGSCMMTYHGRGVRNSVNSMSRDLPHWRSGDDTTMYGVCSKRSPPRFEDAGRPRLLVSPQKHARKALLCPSAKLVFARPPEVHVRVVAKVRAQVFALRRCARTDSVWLSPQQEPWRRARSRQGILRRNGAYECLPSSLDRTTSRRTGAAAGSEGPRVTLVYQLGIRRGLNRTYQSSSRVWGNRLVRLRSDSD
jgi:hypothetical protein